MAIPSEKKSSPGPGPVSVVATVYNEAGSIVSFVESLLRQTRLPDEIVILDGGSTDGTAALLEEIARREPRLRIIVDPACNIRYSTSPVAKGRNIAIRQARGKIIAVTDAGCRVDDRWTEEILRPFSQEASPDVVVGWYEPWIETAFERAAAAVTFTISKEKLEKTFFPSSRSVAFTKEIWERVGGYPEVALTAEDTLFNAHLLKAGITYRFTDKAVVYWRPRGSVRLLARQYYRYSKGDAICGLNLRMHIEMSLKYLALGLLVAWAAVIRSIWPAAAALGLFGAYLLYLGSRPRYRAALPASLALKMIIDAARLCGYCAGFLKRLQGKHW